MYTTTITDENVNVTQTEVFVGEEMYQNIIQICLVSSSLLSSYLHIFTTQQNIYQKSLSDIFMRNYSMI